MNDCKDGKCCACFNCKKLDVEDRLKDSWMDIELFRIIEGRLPSENNDDVTKSMAKKYIDKYVFGESDHPSTSCDLKELEKFSFHVYSSTNMFNFYNMRGVRNVSL